MALRIAGAGVPMAIHSHRADRRVRFADNLFGTSEIFDDFG
jgi:hypothetical protein